MPGKDNNLVKYDAARQALQEAHSVDEVIEIKDKMQALQAYAKQAKDVDMETWAAEIKLRAMRRAGELSKEIETVQGQRTDKLSPTDGTKCKKDILKEVGLSKQTANRYEQISTIPKEEFETYINNKKKKNQAVSAKDVIQITGKRVRRKERADKILSKNAPLDGSIGTFQVIYADPPWKYEFSASENRAIENHYPTMPLDEIKALPVEKITAEDAILFLWATTPKNQEALEVMNSWGFAYRTGAVWVKESIGTGHWFRQQHELLLIGTKGKIPAPLENVRYSSVINAPRRAHSQKPDQVYEIIENGYPEFNKIELFARKDRPGWYSWGNEVQSNVVNFG